MEAIKAKEVIYMGFRFRSITEAMWASFLHALKIRFKYEPTTLSLPNGMKYLPDFNLGAFYAYHDGAWHGENLWAEAKGVTGISDLVKKPRDVAKAQSLSGSTWHDCSRSENPIIILPKFPHTILEWLASGITTFEFVDGDYFPCFISKNNLDASEVILCGGDNNYHSKRNLELTNYAIAFVWEEYRQGKFEEVTNK